ncbi:MAG TPA: AMP-binding protein [Acidimicrobiia bacterium]|nr:AMP-binding protein [Acidimicrobiia bacterium]
MDWPKIPRMGLLVGDVIRYAARATPHRMAASLGDDVLTFAEVDRRSNQVARAFSSAGIGHGDRVAWWGETSLEAMAIFGALAKLGAVFMPVNARLGPEEAADILSYAKPRLLVVDLAHTGLIAGPSTSAGPLPVITHDTLFRAAGPESEDDVAAPDLDERDPHVIFFTSGSTGRPKGVVLSHRTSFLRSFPSLLADHHGGTVCMFPLFHMAGWSMTMNAWQMRCPVHFAAPDAASILATAEQRRASRLYCIPAVWWRVLEHDRSRYDLTAVEECDTGTSATPPELLVGIKAAFPAAITRIYYGSTEAGPAALLGDMDLFAKPGAVGLPPPGVEVRLADDGEVCVRSEFLMDDYFENPEATADALRPLDPGGPVWYHTGDLGAFDDDGYLSIVGRARDVLRSGGETIAPGEVEAVLADHPGIAEVAVVGIPDPEWGEVVCAVVVPASDVGRTLDVDGLRRHCDGRLAAFKHPRRVEVVDALPRTAATGQIQRALIVGRIAGT